MIELMNRKRAGNLTMEIEGLMSRYIYSELDQIIISFELSPMVVDAIWDDNREAAAI